MVSIRRASLLISLSPWTFFSPYSCTTQIKVVSCVKQEPAKPLDDAQIGGSLYFYEIH